ncbi:MAG: hypothetical protein J7539_13340 [Niabella sp.]|nr:hypothetical protein [Niabella sp.]
MIKSTKLNLLGVILFFISCAPMPPTKVNTTLPALTKSKFITLSQAEEMTKTGKCKYLVKNRNYAAPMALSAKGDLKQCAKGIDEWVKLDGGNAYVLKNYKWVSVDGYGSAQLHLEFDTMLCE